jgi:phosphonate degradation associated HDIG domain protein
MRIVNEIMDLIAKRGAAAYHGEAVSQEEHALQAAELAEREGSQNSLVVAALLHDIGHLLDGQNEDLAELGVDGRHEEAACAWLERHFPPEVTEPIRLHVAAKRYLCAVESKYQAGLSPASRMSLELQGGPMTSEEVADFEGNEFFQEAVRLRYWDDAAKILGLAVPGAVYYRKRIEAEVGEGSPRASP